MLRSTNKREPAMQDWPVEEKMPNRTPAQAMSRSASANTIVGDLPPSSRDTVINLSAALRANDRPVSVPPVNETFLTVGCVTSRSPTIAPAPGSVENNPLGRPASSTMRASSSETNGLQDDGLSRIALPAANAGATFCASEGIGELHGVMP